PLGGVSSARADINGFGDGTGYTVNNNASGAASISGGTLTITTAVASQASSVFNNTPQNIGNFTASFTYTDVSTGGADGFAFVLQNDPRGTASLGDAGGQLGYGSGGTPSTAITPSAAMTFNIYSGNGGSSAGFGSVGNVRYSPTGNGVDITNGQPVNVTVNYAPFRNTGIISATLTQGGNSYTTRPQLYNATGLAGGNTALVGFTGGTGGLNATQTLGSFTFTSGNAVAPAGPYNVLQSTDAVTAINGTQFPNGNGGTFTPATEGVEHAIDKGSNAKYLNFGGAGSGFQVTPAIGSTIVSSLVLTSANDAPERDPASYQLLGSNDGSTFVQIASGTVPAFPGRLTEQELTFANALPYTQYQVIFPTVADPTTNNSMQIGEVQLVGVAAVPEPTGVALLALGGALPLLRRRRA
ncbi:MAG TPA: PEP-CTERM sorting domain-containing protein, partial [Tepidisphaeraceae bacterium]